MLGPEKLRESINPHSRIKLGPLFDWMIKLVIPVVILVILGFSIRSEMSDGGLYGSTVETGTMQNLHVLVLAGWLVFTILGSMALTAAGGFRRNGSSQGGSDA